MSASPGTEALLPVAGAGRVVDLADGGCTRYVNLDHAASTPPLLEVVRAIDEFVPWYSSVHRGTGWFSRVSTMAYEAARDAVAHLVGARPGDQAIFVRSTTEGVNLVAHGLDLGPDDAVLTTLVEHHSNLLPWRRAGRVVSIPPPATPGELLENVEAALAAEPAIRVVALTGASNVTGEVFPIAEIAAAAHRHGAIAFVDAAQLVPHRQVDLAATDVDLLAFSGHKMYAPYGAGAVVGRTELLRSSEPFLVGGGAVTLVTATRAFFKPAPDGLEAGTPNVLGALAVAAAASALERAGLERVAAHEGLLTRRMVQLLGEVPGLTLYRLWGEDADRVGVATFNLAGLSHGLVAAALSAEHGIAVRNGCFCAQPYVAHLLGMSEAELEERATNPAGRQVAGAVRASVGVDTSEEDVEALAAALRDLATRGPRLEYAPDPLTGDITPVDDRRHVPKFGWLPELPARGGSGCDPL